jgi:DHA3 family macrolide efflux protein-like MFS transporter
LGLFGYVSLANFLLNPVSVLLLPYLLARSQNTTTFGFVMGVINVGSIIGAAAMTAWGGTRPRIHTIVPGIALIGAFMAMAGSARAIPWIAASFFVVNFANAFVNAAVLSVLQAKVPPDLQGRVFAALGQVTALFAPVGYLVAGPLTDGVFEPAVRLPAWSHVAWLVGAGPGAGIGLMLFIGGSMTVLLSLIVYGLPTIRGMEAALPDYEQINRAANAR